MISSQKIISALHANWWLNVAGLLLSFGASVVLSVVSRGMPSGVAQGSEDLIEDRFRGGRIAFSDH
jgi:hypothetical protein